MNARDNPHHPEYSGGQNSDASLTLPATPADRSQSAHHVVVRLQAALDAKRLANAKARAALRGIALHQLEADDGGLLLVATQWHLTKLFSSLDEVEAWLEKVGAPST